MAIYSSQQTASNAITHTYTIAVPSNQTVVLDALIGSCVNAVHASAAIVMQCSLTTAGASAAAQLYGNSAGAASGGITLNFYQPFPPGGIRLAKSSGNSVITFRLQQAAGAGAQTGVSVGEMSTFILYHFESP